MSPFRRPKKILRDGLKKGTEKMSVRGQTKCHRSDARKRKF